MNEKYNLNYINPLININYVEILVDNSLTKQNNNNFKKENISVFFKEIKIELIKQIQKYDMVFGCVAWLSDFEIIDALSKKKVSIIINKEDFLRPDCKENQLDKLQYNKLSNDFERGVLTGLNCGSQGYIEPIRCCGYAGNNKIRPRMHNKFLIFGKMIDEEYYEFKPLAVWTGSFNMSHTASNSFENVILIENEEIASIYFKEYIQILSLSETLDWNKPYVEAQYRYGT